MSIIVMAAVGIAAVLTALQLKGTGGVYGTYVVLAAGLFLFYYSGSKLSGIMGALEEAAAYIRIGRPYLEALLKMVGITYVGQFSAGICKDAGYSSVAGQIELFSKLSVLAISMPILTALLETIHEFLG